MVTTAARYLASRYTFAPPMANPNRTRADRVRQLLGQLCMCAVALVVSLLMNQQAAAHGATRMVPNTNPAHYYCHTLPVCHQLAKAHPYDEVTMTYTYLTTHPRSTP